MRTANKVSLLALFVRSVLVNMRGPRVDPSLVAPMATIKLKGRERKGGLAPVVRLKVEWQQQVKSGGIVSLSANIVSECRGGWNVDFGDGELWYLKTTEFEVI